MMNSLRITSLFCLLILVVMLTSFNLAAIERSIERHELSNGATLILLPKSGVPIVSCITLTAAGGVKEKPGITGISHFLEHMAFKGTGTIGTKDIDQEKEALENCHRIFDNILAERGKGDNTDPEKLTTLENELQTAIEYANQFAIDNEFSKIMELNGGKGLNAATGQDMTMYSVSLPSNKLELWMLMESERFTKPVFREFYQEKNVILEERNMIYSNPIRAFMNDFASFVYTEHPYQYSVIGDEEDIRNLTVRNLEEYFEEHYGAQNLVFTLVGDINIQETLDLAERYLGQIPRGRVSGRVEVHEPPQTEERIHTTETSAQPFLIVAYHIPGGSHPDSPVLDVIADVLGQGRSSRLNRVLVQEKKLAAAAFCYTGFPGSSYDNLFVVGVIPSQGTELADCLAEIDEQIALLLRDNITPDELAGVKKRALRSSYDRLGSRFGLAMQLAYYEALYGDYKLMFDELKQTENVQLKDVERVLRETFRKENRVIGKMKTRSES